MQAVLLGDTHRLANLFGGPLAGAPVVGLAGGDDLAHRENDLFHRRLRIGPVRVEDVDKICLEPLERTVDRLHEVLAIEGVVHVRNVSMDAPERLRGEHVRPARPTEFPKDAAHDRLGLAPGIHLGVVEEIAARLAGGVDAVTGETGVELVAEGDPAAEGQHAHTQAGRTETSVLHVRIDVGG